MPQVRHGREIFYALINIPAGASTEVVALVTGRRIVPVGMIFNTDVAGTVTLVHTTAVPVALSGVLTMGIADTKQLGDFDHAITETPISLNFGFTTVTCTLDGLLAYYLD